MLALKELLIECQIGDKLAPGEVGKISKKRKSADQQQQNGPSTSGTDLADTGVDTGTSNASSPLESKGTVISNVYGNLRMNHFSQSIHICNNL